jgi:hypothetical protein
MWAMRTTTSSTAQCSYRCGKTLGGNVSGFARLASVEGFCSAWVANALVLAPGPWEFLLLDGEAGINGDSTRCFGPGGTALKGRAGVCAAAAGRSSEAAIALRRGDESGSGSADESCTRGSNAPVA